MSKAFDLGYKMEGFTYQKECTPLKVILVWKGNPTDVGAQ